MAGVSETDSETGRPWPAPSADIAWWRQAPTEDAPAVTPDDRPVEVGPYVEPPRSAPAPAKPPVRRPESAPTQVVRMVTAPPAMPTEVRAPAPSIVDSEPAEGAELATVTVPAQRIVHRPTLILPQRPRKAPRRSLMAVPALVLIAFASAFLGW